jgi:uncharacterized protein with NRDE domain
MCTLAIFRNAGARYPLVIAANRDEYLERPASAPARLEGMPAVVAGRDLEAGGTWLGCRVDGPFLLAGLLNRRTAAGPGNLPHGMRSRGLLCLDALEAASVDAFDRGFDDVGAVAHGPFNLLLADAGRAVVFDNRDGAGRTELDTGLSVLTNLDVNDPRCPRLASATRGFSEVSSILEADPGPGELVTALAAVLADHAKTVDPSDSDPFARVCVHAGPYGTRSSSIILLTDDAPVSYLHAAGPPCLTSFEPLAL